MSPDVLSIPAPLCGHGHPAIRSDGRTARCFVCGSFWDLSALRTGFQYDASYPEIRGHTSEAVGQLKIKSLQRWLARLRIDLSRFRVCEIGFGGAWPLAFMREHALSVFGIEAIQENIDAAVRLGLDRSCLFDANSLPAALPSPVDLWVYQDSFEHVPDPLAHLDWVVRNSSASPLALLILPDATSVSERFLGRLWPHRIPDHVFHWSQKGLENIWGQFGFKTVERFDPVKCVTIGMLAVHAAHKFRIHTFESLALRGPSIWFNIGQQGLLMSRGR